MKYVIEEDFSISAYQAVVTFDEKISHYKVNDDFSITIQDMINEKQLFIDNTDIDSYGLTEIDGDVENWENDSFIANGGVLIYFMDARTLFIKLLAHCHDQNDESIGFNCCNVHIIFNQLKQLTADVNAVIWPKIYRSHIFKQIDDSAEDPVLPEANLRCTYNEETGETLGFDFDADPELEDNASDEGALPPDIKKNFNYNSTDTIYVNSIADSKGHKVPTYVNEVSAFYTPNDNLHYFDYSIDPVTGSMLVNTENGQQITIPYTSAHNQDAHLIFPIYKNGEYQYDYTCDIQYDLFAQKLEVDKVGKFKNKLYLGVDMNVTNSDVGAFLGID